MKEVNLKSLVGEKKVSLPQKKIEPKKPVPVKKPEIVEEMVKVGSFSFSKNKKK